MKTVHDLYPEFVKEVDGLSADQLKARIVSLQQGLKESEEHKADNEAIQDARAEVRLLSEPYADVKKAVKLKTSHLLELLEKKA